MDALNPLDTFLGNFIFFMMGRKMTSRKGSVFPPEVDPRFRCFAEETAEERLDLKSLKGRTKAEELGDPVPELLSFRPSLKAL